MDIRNWLYPVRQGEKVYHLNRKTLVDAVFIAFVPKHTTINESLRVYEVTDFAYTAIEVYHKNRCVISIGETYEVVPESKLFTIDLLKGNHDLMDNKYVRESSRLSKVIVCCEIMSHKFGKYGVGQRSRIVSRDDLLFESKYRCEYSNECNECLINREVNCNWAVELTTGKGIGTSAG